MALRMVIALLLVTAVPASATAATFTVTKATDTRDGVCNADCSLREAVDAANANGDADTVVLPARRYRLDRYDATKEDLNVYGDLDVTAPLTISGDGAATTTIRTRLEERILDVHGAATSLTLTGITLTGAREYTGNGGGINAPDGGDVTVQGVVVFDNVASNAGVGFGGGIAFDKGRLTISDSALVDNSGNLAGALYLNSITTRAEITNTTFVGNSTTSGPGGAIYSNSGMTATLSYVSVVDNAIGTGTGGAGLGGDTSAFTIRSSIVARNTTSGGLTSNCDTAYGPVSGGGNVTNDGCNFTAATDAVADPKLGPLTTAGPIPVMVPLEGSPAVDRGVGACPAADARGITRPQGAACDSGAAEREVAAAQQPQPQPSEPAAAAPPATVIPSLSGTARVGRTLSCRAKVARSTSLRYRWLRGRKAITGATKSRYKLTRKDRGRVVACRVTATGPGGSVTTVSLGVLVR